jgi:2-keto-4-pentenoate hydratase/2-oxohepta-3-ene-1,7-dioic acid hydratase in catechol pathway
MRLVTFRSKKQMSDPPTVGVFVSGTDVVSVSAFFELLSADGENRDALDLSSLKQMLATGGLPALDRLERGLLERGQLTGRTRPSVIRADDCVFEAPLRPGKIVTVARNYPDHLAETADAKTGPVPSASIKATSSVCGPYDKIVRPACERHLDYETELAVVIGRRCKNVPASNAYEVIAGYMVMNDVVAREILTIERRAGNQFLGKMFDGFAPMGPALVSAREVGNPMGLKIETRVNGELRQSGNTRDMIWPIAQLIAYFSQATLEPGDVISTGTPAGVAAGRKADESPWFLQLGDLVESTVENVGTLCNQIVADETVVSSWDWERGQ